MNKNTAKTLAISVGTGVAVAVIVIATMRAPAAEAQAGPTLIMTTPKCNVYHYRHVSGGIPSRVFVAESRSSPSVSPACAITVR